MEFSRQEYRSGLCFLLQGIFPTQGSDTYLLCLLHWQADSLLLSHLGNPRQWVSPGVKCAERGGILSRVQGEAPTTNNSNNNNINTSRTHDTSSVPGIALNALKPCN